MAGKKHGDNDGRKKTGPGQPDKDRRVTQGTMKVGRDASTGQFIPVEQAKKRPSTAIVQTIKKPVPPKPTKKK